MSMEAFPLPKFSHADIGHPEAVARVTEDLVVEARAQECVEIEPAPSQRVSEVGEAEAVTVRPVAGVDAVGMPREQGEKGDDDRQEHELAHERPLTVFT